MIYLKTLLLFIQISFINVAFANVDIDECSRIAEFNAHHSTPQSVPSSCKYLVKNLAGIYQRIQTSDGLYDIYGHKNMIYVDYYQMVDNNLSLVDSKLLAGDQTKLHEVVSLDIDEENKKLYVLNRNFGTTSFAHYSLDFIGNVAPSRHYAGSELNGIVSFRISTTDEMIYLIDQVSAQIKVYNLQADPDSKNSKHSVHVQRSIAGVKTQMHSPNDLAISQSEIYVLDNDRVLVFENSANEEASPTRIIAGQNTSLSSAKAVNLSADGELLYVTNGDDQVIQLPSNGNGNISPIR